MKRLTTEEFNSRVKELNANLILKSEYVNKMTKCEFYCTICKKSFYRTPKAFLYNSSCKWCSLKEKHQKQSELMKSRPRYGCFDNAITLERFKERCKDISDFEVDYSTYKSRKDKVRVRHKACSRWFYIKACAFYTTPKCLACVEDDRRAKISKSLKSSEALKKHHERRNVLCNENFKDIVYKLVGDEYTFLEPYIDNCTRIKVRHNLCGHEYEVSPNHFISKGTRCPYCFRSASNAELDVKLFIENSYSGEIYRNVRNVIPPHELDIYIPEKKLAIEFNGTYWHSSLYKDKNYHFNKSQKCEEKGIRLIHIWEYEWDDERQRPILENIIKNALGVNENKIYARKLDIEIRPSKEMREFFNKNNIQGFRPGKFSICLVDKKTREVYMAYQMGHCYFGKGKYEWEVIRGATKLGCTVVGGASKIWKYFIDNYNPQSCVYYIDYNYFNGNSLPYLGLQYIATQSSFKNLWVETGEVRNREPSRHKEIKELREKGLVIPLYNAGTKVYIYNKE